MACCNIRFTLDFTTECFRENAKHYITVNFIHQESERRTYFASDGVTQLNNVDFIAIRVTRPRVSSDYLSFYRISKIIDSFGPIPGLIKRIPANYYTEMPNKLRFKVFPNCSMSTEQMFNADTVFNTPDYTETLADGTVVEYKFFVNFTAFVFGTGESLNTMNAVIDMPVVRSDDIGPMVVEVQKQHGSNQREVTYSLFSYKPIHYVPSSSGVCKCGMSDTNIVFPHNVPDGLSLSLCTYDINQLAGFRLVEGPYNYYSFSNTRRKACSDCSRFAISSFTIPSLANQTEYRDYLYMFFQPCADINVSLSDTFGSTTGVSVQKVESSITDMLPLPYSTTYKAYQPVSIRLVPTTATGTNTNPFRLDNIFQGTHVPFLLGSFAVWIVRIDNQGFITYIPYSDPIQYVYDPIAAAPYASVLTPNGL